MYAAEWPCCHDPLRFSLGSEDLSRTARDNPLQPPSPSLPPPPRPLPSGQSVARAPFLDFANPLNGESATCLNPEPQSVAHAPFLDFAKPPKRRERNLSQPGATPLAHLPLLPALPWRRAQPVPSHPTPKRRERLVSSCGRGHVGTPHPSHTLVRPRPCRHAPPLPHSAPPPT